MRDHTVSALFTWTGSLMKGMGGGHVSTIILSVMAKWKNGLRPTTDTGMIDGIDDPEAPEQAFYKEI